MSHPILLDALSCEFTDKKHASSSLRENASPASGSFVVINPTQIIPLLPKFPNAKMTAHPSKVCSAEAVIQLLKLERSISGEQQKAPQGVNIV